MVLDFLLEVVIKQKVDQKDVRILNNLGKMVEVERTANDDKRNRKVEHVFGQDKEIKVCNKVCIVDAKQTKIVDKKIGEN